MMKRVLVGMAGLAMLASAGFADEKSDMQAAVKKLADGGNYSWVATVEGGFGGSTEGKIDKDGTAVVTTTFQDTPLTFVMKGSKGAAKMESGWMSQAELQKAADDAGGFSPEMIMSFRIAGFKAPAVQAKEMGEKLANAKKMEGGFSADLTPDMAKELLTFRRPAGAGGANFPEVTVNNAKGDVKFWVKDGAVTKMALHLTGTRSFGDQENEVNQTTTTEFKDVGTTKVTVPDEAKKKLDGAATKP